MKRWAIIGLSAVAGTFYGGYSVVNAGIQTGWLDLATALSIQALQLDSRPDVYCNEPSSALTSRKLVGCFGGSAFTSPRSYQEVSTDMAFGSLTSDGRLKLGSLPYPHHVQLPEHYQLFPVAGSRAALLVDDGRDDHLPVPAAYYADVLENIDWLGLRLRPPATQQLFVDGAQFLEVSAFGLASSRNGRYVVGNSVVHGMIRLDVEQRQFVRFGTNMRLQAGGRLVKPIPAMAITDDGATAFAGFPTANEGTQIYDVASSRDCVIGSSDDGCIKRDITAFLREKIPAFQYTAHIQSVSEDTVELLVATGTSTNLKFSRYRLATKPLQVDDASYLALGDSFASGEGAYYYRAGTDTPPNKCHVSNASYPYLLRPDAQSVACSGARLRDVDGSVWGQRTGRQQSDYSTTEINQLLSRYTPGNLNQLAFLRYYHPTAATVMIGGNDIGFSDIVKVCIDPRRTLPRGTSCYPSYEDRTELLQSVYDQYDAFVQTFRRLQAASYETTLYAIGYPQVVSTTGGCGLNVQLDETERELTVVVIDALNVTLSRAARVAGVHFVDTAEAFEGHKLCQSGLAAMNGISMGDDGLRVAGTYLLGQESFHPTALGQRLLAQSIARQTDNLSLGRLRPVDTAKPSIDVLQPFFQAIAQVGRALRTRVVDQSIATDVVGGSIVINLADSSYRLKQHQIVNIQLGPSNYTAVTDSNGHLSAECIVPSSGVSHYSALHVYATDQSGRDLDITKVVAVESPSEKPTLTLQVGQISGMTPSDK